MFPLTDHDYSEGEQWGRDQIYPDYYKQLFKRPGLSDLIWQLQTR